MSDSIEQLFSNNQTWVAQTVAEDADFFSRLARIQAPDYLWVGCSDSRVPANVITGLQPGEVFVHRNIANVVQTTDPNCMAVVEYAVGVLAVKHVIVCGHYGCGGVQASITGDAPAGVHAWLHPVRALYAKEQDVLDQLDEDARWARLCELNVIEQVGNTCRSAVVERLTTRLQGVGDVV